MANDAETNILSISATCFVHIVAIIMTAIMIYHIRSKYTAVGELFAISLRCITHRDFLGRKEIVTFFWLYMVIELLAIFLDSGIIPTANAAYPVRLRSFSIPDSQLKEVLSGSPPCTRGWLQQPILVFSSTGSSVSNSLKMALRCRFG